MNKVKIYFCLFLCIISFSYFGEILKKIDVFKLLIKDTIVETKTVNSFTELNSSNKQEIINKEKNKDPIVYFYNTHESEEYKSNV